MTNRFLRWLKGWFNGIVLIAFLMNFSIGMTVQAKGGMQITGSDQAKLILSRMDPKQRVGQLFLVTFRGRQADIGTPIFDLIKNQQIGGVVLQTSNDNFTGPDGTIDAAYQLINQLQKNVWESSQAEVINPATNTSYVPEYIPLFIGISQAGDGGYSDQIFNGMTPLPSSMAVGATWKLDSAEQIGSVLGKELSAMGFNLLIGPSLDVLDVQQEDSGENLGIRTFGGDPYWVGEMGKAYITGVHNGSNNQIAVISTHFPGRGSSDRPPESEVATVRKSLEQLKQIELPPFFAVTGNAPTTEATTDGLMVSHIRYQGFQGNIRATTKPVSFDQAALDLLMALPPFSSWRKNGGVMVTDDLGSQAVRKFYDPTGQQFETRQVALNALLAGNDLLYMDYFVTSDTEDSITSVIHTIDFFAQKYREDPAFAQRVDSSAERLIQLKLRMYGQFTLDSVIPPAVGLNVINKSQQTAFDVAQKGATLLSPDATDLASTLPRPPESRDRIVFITDVVTRRQCSQCTDQFAFGIDTFENTVLKLYGPNAGGQVLKFRLSSYSVNDLYKMLNGTSELPDPLETDLKSADWVIISFTNINSSRQESLAIRQLLSEKLALIRDKKVVAFAFNAPYYLDATDISKLTAYYGLFSKVPTSVDMAARLLFQELPPVGASPVSIPGIGYDLINITQPEPSQVIPLLIDEEALTKSQQPTPSTDLTLSPLTSVTPVPTVAPAFKVGDVIPLRTGVIYDHNHNQVPDGTVARFIFTTGGENGTSQQVETTTIAGIARSQYRILNKGTLDIRVTADPALVSDQLKLEVSGSEAVTIIAITPTSQSSTTPQPSLTPTLTTTPTPTLIATPTPADTGIGDWFISMLVIGGIVLGGLGVGRRWISLRWGIRIGLLSALGGLLFYTAYVMSNLNKIWYSSQAHIMSLIGFTVLGSLVGLLVGIAWWKFAPPPVIKRGSRNINE